MNIDEQLGVLLETTKDLLKVAQIQDKKSKQHDDLILQLATSTIDHSETLEQYLLAIEAEKREREESRRDFEFRLNALIDSQIAREDDLLNLKKDVREALERISHLENQNGKRKD